MAVMFAWTERRDVKGAIRSGHAGSHRWEVKLWSLKRVQVSIPAGHDLSGLTFVIRSADSTAWWRDGGLQAHMAP